MAKIDRLEDRKKGDRLTAQLGLGAAGEVGETGACLTPDQLADVATNHCSPEERKAALEHFSSCRKCYDAWVGVSLSLVAMESGLERRKRPLLSIRNMGYLGSAMAIAAGIVVFLNIRGDLVKTTVVAPAGKTVERVEQLDEAPRQQVLMKEEAVSQPSVVAPPAVLREKAKKTTEPEKPERRLRQESKGAVGSNVQEQQAVPQSAPAPAAVEDRAALQLEAEIAITPAGWLAGLERYCRERRYNEDLSQWNLLREEGIQLRDSETDAVLQKKLAAVLAMMTGASKNEDVMSQCNAVLPLLAGEDKKE